MTTQNSSSSIQVKRQLSNSFNKEKIDSWVSQPFEFVHKSHRYLECFKGEKVCHLNVFEICIPLWSLSKPVLGPVLDLSRRCASMDIGLHQRWFGRRWQRRFLPLFAPVCDGEATLNVVMEAYPRQEVGGYMLGLDPRAGAHFSFPSLVEGHEPIPTSPVVPVDDWGVGVVAVLLEALPELTGFCK